MKPNEMDQKINQTFTRIIPDVLVSVLSDCKEQKGMVVIMTQKKKANRWFKCAAAVAAALILFVSGAAAGQFYRVNKAVASTISLDVNPSIEISINEKERVLAVNAMNEDARVVISNMDFTGNTLDVTINALIGSMLRNGYLNEITNSILVSVDNTDPVKGTALQQKLAGEIDSLLQTETFHGSVLSQTVTSTDELQTLADTYGITQGKAQLIQKIIDHNSFYTFNDLVSLSINELNLLTNSGKITLEDVNSIGTASDKAYIGRDAALSAALSHAGLKQTDISFSKIELDYEHGNMEYDVEFYYGGYEYSYEINALNGTVISYKQEKEDDALLFGNNFSNNSDNRFENTASPAPTASQTDIGKDAALNAALNHAGLKQTDVSFSKVEQDYEHSTMVYEVEFYYRGYEYSYEINAANGSVVEYEIELDD